MHTTELSVPIYFQLTTKRKDIKDWVEAKFPNHIILPDSFQVDKKKGRQQNNIRVLVIIKLGVNERITQMTVAESREETSQLRENVSSAHDHQNNTGVIEKDLKMPLKYAKTGVDGT